MKQKLAYLLIAAAMAIFILAVHAFFTEARADWAFNPSGAHMDLPASMAAVASSPTAASSPQDSRIEAVDWVFMILLGGILGAAIYWGLLKLIGKID